MNIILIGMPGAGKSTIGVVLAKTLGFKFIDTDLIIQEQEGRMLQDIINSDGMESFLDIEGKSISELECDHAIVATGGSVIYRKKGMEQLIKLGKVIFLDVPYDEIERRVNNITTRGIAIRGGATLQDVFDERYTLYKKYADDCIDCMGMRVEQIVDEVVKIIE